MKLRSLILEDAIYMMEFIDDKEIAVNFKFTRNSFSLKNFEEFITNSWTAVDSVHFAVEDDKGEYAGTISLKNINNTDKTAEYAIVLRKKFWGCGIAKEATELIIEYARNSLRIRKIYLQVLSTNRRANKFYNKLGFEFEGIFKEHIFINEGYVDLNWYCLFVRR